MKAFKYLVGVISKEDPQMGQAFGGLPTMVPKAAVGPVMFVDDRTAYVMTTSNRICLLDNVVFCEHEDALLFAISERVREKREKEKSGGSTPPPAGTTLN